MSIVNARRKSAVVGAGIAVLAIPGCAESTTDAGGGGASVEPGATRDEYVEALADMEPVELIFQSTAPKGAPTGRRWEEYAAAVEEWSGGKISFEVAFGNSIVEPIEVDNAVVDTRIDLGSYSASSEAQEFPANGMLAELNFLGSQKPLGSLLQWHGAMLQAVQSTPEIEEEFDEKGIKLLVPAFQSGGNFLACAEPAESAADLSGRTVASQNLVQSRQLEALGMSPVSMAFPELFESIERGAVECAMSSLTVAQLTGIIPVAPHFHYVSDAGWGNASGAFVMGKDRWEALPLAAQQLMHDRLDVFFHANFESTLTNVDDAMSEIEAAGGEVAELPPEAADILRAENDAIVDDARSSQHLSDPDGFVTSLVDAFDTWEGVLDGKATSGAEVAYNEFQSWYDTATLELDSYYERLWEEVLLNTRPE